MKPNENLMGLRHGPAASLKGHIALPSTMIMYYGNHMINFGNMKYRWCLALSFIILQQGTKPDTGTNIKLTL